MLVFASLKSLIPKVDGVSTDNWVFRLHSNVTIIFLIGCTIIATSREYIGNPIECAMDGDKPSKDVLNQFCWITSTFSFPYYWKGDVGEHITYPGIGPLKKGQEHKVYHKYYQWVVFMLCLQAILFYVPRYFWKIWEGGKLKMLLQGLNSPIWEPEEKKHKLDLLYCYFVNNRGSNNFYAFKYAVCEILNLINVVGQIYMIDKFLDGEFRKYGLQVFSFLETEQQDRVDPMVKIFPLLTKCTWYDYGTSGDVQRKHAQCVLPLNVINAKIFVFMWLWFCILTSITSLAVLYRFLVFGLPFLRVASIRRHSHFVNSGKVQDIISNMAIGDWFILNLLSKNMDSAVFNDFLLMLSSEHENPKYEIKIENAHTRKGSYNA